MTATYQLVGEAEPVAGGLRLQRVPESVRGALRPGGAMMALSPAAVEIRTVGPRVRLAVSAGPDPEGVYRDFARSQVLIYLGRIRIEAPRPIGPEPTVIDVEVPAHLARLAELEPAQGGFGSLVWRFVFGLGPVILHSVEGDGLRPPRADELPSRRLLAYGTSITHGANASTPVLSYPAIAARALDADLRNLGLAGNAFCEPELADYIASLEWDVATTEISVNMIESGVPLDEFAALTQEFLRRLAADSRRRVVCVSPFSYYRDAGVDLGVPPPPAAPAAYRASLQEFVARSGASNLEFVDGRELLPGLAGLAADLIHPLDEGMVEIGTRLAQRLRGSFPQSAP